MMNKAEKTKAAIAQSLVEMLQRKPLDLITVSDLTANAGVGRTAYYNNFKNLEDVLKYIYRKAHHEFFGDKFKDPGYQFSDTYIKDMIDFFDHYSRLLSTLIKWDLIDIIAKYNTNLVLAYTEKYDDKIIKENAFYFICYTSSAIFNICVLWVAREKKESKEELFRLIKYFQHQSQQSQAHSSSSS